MRYRNIYDWIGSQVDQLADVKELYRDDRGQCRSCLSSDCV